MINWWKRWKENSFPYSHDSALSAITYLQGNHQRPLTYEIVYNFPQRSWFLWVFPCRFLSLPRVTHILRGRDKNQCLGVYLLPLGSGVRCYRPCGSLVHLHLVLPSLA